MIVSTTWISLLVLAAMLAACTGERGESLGIPLEWTAVDSVNAQLPSGIRVYAGMLRSRSARGT